MTVIFRMIALNLTNECNVWRKMSTQLLCTISLRRFFIFANWMITRNMVRTKSATYLDIFHSSLYLPKISSFKYVPRKLHNKGKVFAWHYVVFCYSPSHVNEYKYRFWIQKFEFLFPLHFILIMNDKKCWREISTI